MIYKNNKQLWSSKPFFSICIPQYNRTSFLKKALKSFNFQKFKSFEVCISDGGSTDGRWQEIVSYLEECDFKYIFSRSETNLQYDCNLRASIELATGNYCLLMGNDDEFIDENVLFDINAMIVLYMSPGVVITNYKENSTNKIIRRVRKTKLYKGNVDVAVKNFRNYSFVSGVVLDQMTCRKFATNRWDGSEMYQMYLGTRIVASGLNFLSYDYKAVGKDIQIIGEEVDSYTKREKNFNINLKPICLPLHSIGNLVVDAVVPFTPVKKMNNIIRTVFFNYLLFTYGFWIFNYREVQSWRYSAGVCFAMAPSKVMKGLKYSYITGLYIWIVYLTVTVSGLLLPSFMFRFLRPFLYMLAKKQ